MDLIGKTTIHPVLFYTGKISGYITWIILFLLIFDINIVQRIEIFYKDIVSFFMLFTGLFFIVLSLFNLGKSTRLGIPSEETVLKTAGLYKYSRNPMYLGFNLLTIASMIYALDIWIFLSGIYSIFIYHFIILGEEKFLESRFGVTYSIYKKKVRRYL
jgi:protein-S-isoprenylcysteine O-methyltransferase Ste14